MWSSQPVVLLGAVALFLLGAWAMLVAVSLIRYRLTLGYPLTRRSLVAGLPYVKMDTALAAARDRLAHLERFMNEFGAEEAVQRDFVETPPGFPEPGVRKFDDDDPARYWVAARLDLQRHAPDLLLAERVTDALVCLRRGALKVHAGELASCVRLERIERRSEELFPFRVTIETARPDALAEALRPIHEWLGIGVYFAPPQRTRLLGKCSVANDGREGIVAGAVGLGAAEYGVAARHVLSAHCGSRYWPNSLAPSQTQTFSDADPDAALIHLGSGCFVHDAARFRDIPCASEANIEALKRRAIPLIKSPGRDRPRGVAESRATEFYAEGRYYRGSHLLILPYYYWRFGVMWPLLRRRFSVEGDSGSWVLDTESGSWVGMVVAGGDHPPRTYALPGYFLMDVFRRTLGTSVTPKLLGV